ncbi:MAG: hypothetical protein ACOC8C_02110 [Chloroflexota bacterium]
MLLSRSELEDLTKTYDKRHVSLYMPTRKSGDEVLGNAIRFKNLLDRARELLVDGGMRQPEAEELLAPARALVNDELFWQRQDDGLAVFLAREFARKHRVPLRLEELVVVGDRFHVKPLISVLSNNGRFYVLALSQHETRLLQGTRHLITEVDLDEREKVPETTIEVLKWEDPERQLQHHAASESTLHHGVAAVFHGHGVASEDDPKEKILRFFHRLGAGISDLLGDDDAPLVPVADDFVLARYVEANTYPHVVEDGIPQAPHELSLADLHRRAWPSVQPLFRQAEEQAREVYEHLLGTESDRVSNKVEEVVSVSAVGRVEGLFVARDLEVWGRWQEAEGVMERHEEQRPGDRDLLDVAAVNTMLHEGWLFVVDAEDVPGGGSVAAVFRW